MILSAEPVNVFYAQVDKDRMFFDPVKATDGASGYDLATPSAFILEPDEVRRIPLNLALVIQVGFEGCIRSRSGLSSLGIVVTNGVGTIDSDFRGEVAVLVHGEITKHLPRPFVEGERIAQIVFQRVPEIRMVKMDFEDLPKTNRGAGGFGSTG